MKSNKDVLSDPSFTHPYVESLSEKFNFRATASAVVSAKTLGRTIREDDNIELVPKKRQNIDFHIQVFNIHEIYKEHHDLIDEAYLKAMINNSSRIQELQQLYVQTGKMTQEELSRIIYGTYMEKSDIQKRPLSKFQQDLMDQFNNLNNV
jgi:hypothetical protein